MLLILEPVKTLFLGLATVIIVATFWVGGRDTMAAVEQGQSESSLESTEPEYLAGVATHIFAARISTVDQLVDVANDPEGPSYRTYYWVTVTEVIKGDLKPNATVRVLQHGGTNGCVAVWFEGDGPLNKGDEYLFVTVTIREVDAYNIFAEGVGNVVLGVGEQRAGEIDRWRSAVMAAGGTPVPRPATGDESTPVTTSTMTLRGEPQPAGSPSTWDGQQCETYYLT